MSRVFSLPSSVQRTWRKNDQTPIDWSISIPGVQIGDYKISSDAKDNNGWVLCDGRSILRKEFPALFLKIGTAFGSDSNTTFCLPNCKGRVIAAVDGNRRALGTYAGAEQHTLTIEELPSHTHNGMTASNGSHIHGTTVSSSGQHSHGINDLGHTHTQTTINDDFNNSGTEGPSFAADSAGVRTWNNISNATTGITINAEGDHTHSVSIQGAGAHSHSFTTDSTGAGMSHNIMQPTVFLGNMYIFSGTLFPAINVQVPT